MPARWSNTRNVSGPAEKDSAGLPTFVPSENA
jgi:hypothetical protein